jgi:tetratricopeptide (TPR) repeat protein
MQPSDLEGALRDVEEAIRRTSPTDTAPSLPSLHFERGGILQQLRRWDEAVQAYRTALPRAANPAPVCLKMAECLLELEHWEEARKALDGYLSLEKGRPDVAAYLARGRTRGKLRDYPGALEDFTHVLAGKPDPPVYALRGWTYLEMDAPRLALEDFQSALRLGPETGELHSGRGLARVRLGQYRESVADAEEALRRGPETHLLVYTVARIYALAATRSAAETEPHTRPRSDRERSSEYEKRAVELLVRAVALVSRDRRPAFWRESVTPDPAFCSVRRTEAYRRLAEECSRTAR